MDPVVQSSFAGGMNFFSEDHALDPDQYKLGFNVRNLTGSLSCIKNPKKIDSPIGKKQGLYGFDQYLVLFSGGAAYYTILDNNGDITAWTRIENFFMNPFVDYIYAQAVPASTLNLIRKLDSTNKVDGTIADTGLSISNIIINGNPAGLICQDGLSQPFLIKSDGTAQRIQTYFQWKEDNAREYVPIGLNMAYINGILFIVSPDRKRIYRSVSGRPLDFVVNVDINGNKGGDAETVSYSVSSSNITCLQILNSGELFVGTLLNCFPLELNYDNTIFQEPTFLNKGSISAGVLNQFSFVDILGDYAFIDVDGMRSFNAVKQLTNEGRDSIFSQYVNKLFTNIVQGNLQCSIVHKNHAYFAVQSIFGNIVLVFNMLTQKWVSVDTFEIPAIKQFAVAKQSVNPQLYFITEREVYKYNGDSTYAEAAVQSRTNISGNAQSEVKLRAVRPVFVNSNDNSVVSIQEISGGLSKFIVNQRLSPGRVFGMNYPVNYPAIYIAGDSNVDNLHFNFLLRSSPSWKVGCEVRWKSQAELALLQTDLDIVTPQTTVRQQSSVYTQTTNVL